mmetsp:Transcript_24866/g.21222  ORF Transcript_24866/g.21222 Transcript_24866/m.21222 type:complete len:101 (+) Transcript_24866:258-560(+)
MKVEDNLRNWFMPQTLFNGEYIPVESSASYSNSGTEMTSNDLEAPPPHNDDDTATAIPESTEASMPMVTPTPLLNNTSEASSESIKEPLMGAQSNIDDTT